MKRYQISASIVAYRNDSQEVLAAINSVLRSSLRVQCTVVDNSPSQDLEAALREAGATYINPGVNLGFGGGHNLALHQVCDSSEYHLVLNPDVHFDPQVLSLLYNFMNRNPDVGLVMPNVLYPDGKTQHLCKQFPSPLTLLTRRFLGRFGQLVFSKQLDSYELRKLDLGVTREIPCLSGCFMFIRSTVLRQVGFFDERYFMYMEDVDLCRRIGVAHKTVFYPEVTVTHGYAKGSYRDLRLLGYHLRSALLYFSKWGWLCDQERSRLNKNVLPLRTELTRYNQSADFKIENGPTNPNGGSTNGGRL